MANKNTPVLKLTQTTAAVSRRGRPPDPARSNRILAAAQTHFLTHGYAHANLDLIAADAGVSKMTIYSHFTSKENLFEAVISGQTDGVVATQRGVSRLNPLQPAVALTTIGKQFLALMRNENTLSQFRILYATAGAQPTACAAFYRQGAERLIRELANYLSAAHLAGALKVPQPQQAADLFLAMFLGDSHIRGLLRLPVPNARSDKALLGEAVRVFMKGFG